MKMKLKLLALLSTLILSTSCLKQQEDNPIIPGVDGPKINVQNGKVILSIGLENVEIDGGATLPVPKLEHSSITLGPRLEGGSMIQVAFDPADIESDEFRVVPHETLPDGRPFPFLVGGTLPALAINVPKAKDMTFYGSTKVFGFFLPIQLPEDFNISIHYRLKINDKNVGIVSLVHPTDGEGAGVVLLLTMDEIRNNKDFKKLLKHSKRRKFKKVLF